jgi:hypothetical protein
MTVAGRGISERHDNNMIYRQQLAVFGCGNPERSRRNGWAVRGESRGRYILSRAGLGVPQRPGSSTATEEQRAGGTCDEVSVAQTRVGRVEGDVEGW